MPTPGGNRRFRVSLISSGLLAAVLVVPQIGGPAGATPAAAGLRAGVAVVDATWHVGASAGQYASEPDPTDPLRDEWDPNAQSVRRTPSYGVASRLTVRAIVLKSPGKAPVALVKTDNYLTQDMLVRRAAQLLADRGSAVTYDHLMVSSSHDHNSPYYSTPAAGVWVFQDVMDLRMFEYQARAIATAVSNAERGMRPASLGATTVDYPWFHGNIAGRGIGEDGAPVGYPMMENDHGLTVVRIDDVSDPGHPKPLTTYVNYAQHGESLQGETNLISADWLAPFERFVDRGTGVPVVFSQGSVGSAEGPYESWYPKDPPLVSDGGEDVPALWAHVGYAQVERGTHLLAEKVIAAWEAIGETAQRGRGLAKGRTHNSDVLMPMTSDVPVAMVTHLVAGPVSHPYPSVSNCRSDQTANGNPGAPVLGLPDCARPGKLPGSPDLWDSLVATGLPIPASYDAASFGAVEENLRIKLQAVRLGDVLLASCACEPQSDLIKALETRTDDVVGNQWNGFDLANPDQVAAAWPTVSPAPSPCIVPAAPTAPVDCPDPGDNAGKRRISVPRAAFDRMEAQINNPADGWDAPAYAPYANSEPSDPTLIKGNFTRAELAPSCGYKVSVGLGHSSDYNGYTVSYREYVARDSYRKALTSYGPHTADYMVTRLVAMAANLRCGTPIPAEPTDPIAAADEARQAAEATAIGEVSSYYYDTWAAQIPDSEPAKPLTQPKDITRFDAATFSWVGGDNWTDNPTVVVERLVDGQWQRYGDMSGEVQTVLTPPSDLLSGAADRRQGNQRWVWTASFEAFDAYPRADVPGGQVPDGTYQFLVQGYQHVDGGVHPYTFFSQPFTVSRWTGITVRDLRRDADGSVSFVVDPIRYPRTYSSPIKLITNDGGQGLICHACSFRPWARTSTVESAQVHVDGVAVPATLGADGRWHVSAPAGATVTVEPGDVRDSYGESNGTRLTL